MSRSDFQEQSAFWRTAIELHEHSGQSIRKFCQAEGLKECLFYRWRKQLGLSPVDISPVQPAEAAQPPVDASTSHPSFVPIQVHPSPPPPEVSPVHSIEIRLPNGIELTVYEADMATLLCDLLQAC